MNKVLVTTSWDDGNIFDLKLAELLAKYEIPATFYLPLRNPERKTLGIREIREILLRRGYGGQVGEMFEIGGHTENHKVLTGISLKEAKKEIVNAKVKLEDIIGREITSFCYPKGMYNQDVKQLVGFSGLTYARTASLFATSIGDFLLSPTTIHAYDHNPFVYLDRRRGGVNRKLFYYLLSKGKLFSNWEACAKESFDYCLRHGGVFHLWGHSWEIEENDDWKRLENVFAYIGKNVGKDRRLTNGQLAEKLGEERLAYYSSVSPVWYHSITSACYYQKELQFLKKITNSFDKSDKCVLDIGCGTGRVSEIFEKASYVGIDYSENLINFAKKNYPQTNKKFIQQKFSQIDDLKPKKWDLILLWGLFESETDPLAKLTYLLKYLKKGTRIIFNLNNGSNPLFNLSKYVRGEFFRQPFPYTAFTPNYFELPLKNFCQKYGFTSRITSFGLLPPSVGGIPGVYYQKLGVAIIVIMDKR